MSATTKFLSDAYNLTPQSAVKYTAVDVSSADFSSTVPFRGIILADAGNVQVTGIDGVDATLPLQAGVNPIGGIGIKAAGTDATALHVAF
jgi:hypothetical protein